MKGRDAELKAALRQLPAPEPSDELLPRILHSRATGVRIASPTRELLIPWRWLAAAAVVSVLIGGSWMVSLSLSRLGSSPAVREPLDEFLRGAGVLPTEREAPASRHVIPPPKYRLIASTDLNVARLTEGTWIYAVEVTTDNVLTQPSGMIGIRLGRGFHAGHPVWMVNGGRQLRGGPWGDYADTTHLDPVSLRPQRSVAYGNKSRTRFLQTFSGDSGREAIDRTGPMERSWHGSVALSFPREALFVNDWSTTRLAVLLPAFPLARRWRGTLYQVAFISQEQVRSIAPLDLRVVGTDEVTVPAGTFDCWRIEVESHLWSTEREVFWVSRDKGWLIKRETRPADDIVVSTVLASYEPGS